jgi:Skp family chaperone for outer membrane proteins
MRKIDQIGWTLAAAIAGGLLSSGFQGTTQKYGVVDISKVVESSDLGKANQATFADLKKRREGLLEFIDQVRVLTNEQAQRLHDLAVKEVLSDTDKAETERIKAEATASNKKSVELSGKPNLTPEERQLLQEYADRAANMERVGNLYLTEFTRDLQSWADKTKLSSLERARAAIQDVAKQGGFTVVFEVGVAPYGANDLTDASLQAMNAKK